MKSDWRLILGGGKSEVCGASEAGVFQLRRGLTSWGLAPLNVTEYGDTRRATGLKGFQQSHTVS